ncbi:MAG: molybdenum cofactor guanylyltransferase MobA [Betaproteobacteria bacterium RIFCSPLOWO2_02_FULL_62_17]|nr:MAG: molybdenum cofactor guanylyltransferase MobA [Betaproteobacteria bacterium RIFCSPLOWO2_02_FULL_62_17]
MSTKQGVCGLILAGGQGRRMGGVDKGLQALRGRPMVQWVLERLSPQVDEILINANQNLDAYGALGYPVIADTLQETDGGFAGPLAGLHAGLEHCAHPLLASVPCDSPFLPADLIARLRSALETKGAQLAVARTGAQAHPVFALMRREVRAHLGEFLSRGGRRIDTWYATLAVADVAFDDEAGAFSNINTRAELRVHEATQ